MPIIRPHQTPQLTERGSMIAPLTHADVDAALGALAPTMVVGDITLYRKSEHHLTVLNYALGKLIPKANVALCESINIIAKRWDWGISLRPGELVRLSRKDLTTVVVLANVDLAGFYAALARIDGISPLLAAALAMPPPPHVTLYTSDPSGKNGIGLNTVADLEDALAGRHASLTAARI